MGGGPRRTTWPDLPATRWPSRCTACGEESPPGLGRVYDAVLCGPCATSTAPVVDPAPPGAGDLYDFQREGVRRLGRSWVHILADDQGLGKTVQALCAIPKGASVLVVCLPSLRAQWRAEAMRWRPDLISSAISNCERPPAPGELVVIGYTQARRWRLQPPPRGWPERSVVILDEPQVLKTASSQQHRGVRRLVRACLEEGGRCWGLSASVSVSEGCWEDTWNVLDAMGGAEAVLGPKRAYLTGVAEGRHDVARRRLSRVLTIRRTDDHLDLPPERDEVEVVTIDEDTQRRLEEEVRRLWAIAQAEREDAEHGLALPFWQRVLQIERGLAEIAERDPAAQVADLVEHVLAHRDGVAFREMSRVRKLLAQAKLVAAAAHADACDARNEPLVVWSYHRDPALQLARRRGWGCIVGGRAKENAADLAAFLAGDLRSMAITIGAGGTGLDGLQRRCARSVFIDLAWVPARNSQARQRLRRIGSGGRSILHTYLVADHALDWRLLERLVEREDVMRKLGLVREAVEQSRLRSALAARRAAAGASTGSSTSAGAGSTETPSGLQGGSGSLQ